MESHLLTTTPETDFRLLLLTAFGLQEVCRRLISVPFGGLHDDFLSDSVLRACIQGVQL